MSLAAAALVPACDRADAARLYRYRDMIELPVAKHRKEPVPVPTGPFQIIISIADQTISVYSGAALVARSVVSTGVPDHPTPMGVFTVIQKQRWHRSNLYSAAPMPYMQRITWSGVALHAGVLPGHPASHGCIRLTEDFAVSLWRMTRLGNRVIIAGNDVTPVEISQPPWFGQAPNPQASASLGEPAEALKAVPAAGMPATGEFIKPVKAVSMAANPAEPDPPASPEHRRGSGDATPVPSPPAAKAEPISAFISRKQGKLFVRQGFTPLFEAAVTIRDPERPLGTHVFTAIDRKENSGAMRWTVVTFPESTAAKLEPVRSEPAKAARRESRRAKPTSAPRPSAERASAALERIEIPQDAAERIAELLTPKSSLIVSDQALSDETDSDTDFIVLVR